MKYTINKSFSMSKKLDGLAIVSCDDYLNTFECDVTVLKRVLNIIKATGSLEEVYKSFSDEFPIEDIKSFLKVLIDENVIFGIEDIYESTVRIGLIGNGEIVKFVEKNLPTGFLVAFSGEMSDVLAFESVNCDAILFLPGETTYRDILEINRWLIKKSVPYLVSRFTGETFIIGPFVFPWKTPCLECHIQQHISLLNQDAEYLIDINDLMTMSFSHQWDNSFTEVQKKAIMDIVFSDVINVKEEKANFHLYKTELVFNKSKFYLPVEKTYQATSECSCCRNMNKNYLFVNKDSELVVPNFTNPFDGSDIKYVTGGLRSVSSGKTMELVSSALESIGLNIKIKFDESNPLSDIVPIYHSTLETTHKNKTPYFFSEQRSHGKGINKEQAYFSAAFEIFERLSSRYFGEKPIVYGSYLELKKYCADIESEVKIVPNINTVYDIFEPSKKIDWVWGYSLIDNKSKLIPASLVFLSKSSFRGNFVPVGSSGLSAGAVLKDAILQGLLELIEHDAWMIAQANTVRLPIITYDGLKNSELKEIITRIQAKGFKIISREYTNDIGIPVIITWISNPRNYEQYAFSGFGAAVSPEIALERSVTEAVQSRASIKIEDVVKYGRADMENLINARDGLFSLFYFQQKDIRPLGLKKDISQIYAPDFSSVENAFDYVVSRIKATLPDADVIFVDLTRESIGIPVVKVFVTNGMQVMGEPILVATERLYNFQNIMGYSERRVEYDELYLAPYPH